jgi:hypothetical protein
MMTHKQAPIALLRNGVRETERDELNLQGDQISHMAELCDSENGDRIVPLIRRRIIGVERFCPVTAVQ